MEPPLINILKAMGNETRLRILNLLQSGDLCVCELQFLLEISQSNISKHLQKLTSAGLLQFYQSAKYVYYTINTDIHREHPFMELILQTETPKLDRFQADRKRLAEYKARGFTCEDLKNGKICFNHQKTRNSY